MKKKILYLTPIPSPFQLELVETYNVLSNKDSIILYYINEITSERKHWKVKNVGETLGKNKIFSLLNILRLQKPEIVIIGSYKIYLIIILIFYKIFTKTKYLIGPLEIVEPSGNLELIVKKLVFKFYSSFSEGTLAVGNKACDFYQDLNNKRVLNVPYAFNLKTLLKKKRNNSNLNNITFLFSGRLEPFRNPLGAIEAFSILSKKYVNKNLKLLISGKGSQYDDCIKRIKELNIVNKVLWKNEFKDWYDIHSIYFDSDVLLAVQNYSGWGIIIQESMAAGMGIIASDKMMASKDLIVNGENGFLVDPKDQDDIIMAMENYIKKPELILAHGLNNRIKVVDLDVSEVAERLIKFIQKIK